MTLQAAKDALAEARRLDWAAERAGIPRAEIITRLADIARARGVQIDEADPAATFRALRVEIEQGAAHPNGDC